jgi:predicted ferric reductase
MSAQQQSTNQFEALPPAMAFRTLVLMLVMGVAGVLAALLVLPVWLPRVSASLLGFDPKAYWYLSRTSALVAYVLLWLSMALGLSLSTRLARLWPGGPAAFDLHRHASLLGLAFALFHALVLLGDKYLNYSVAQVLLPFASKEYRPLWVGLGQIGLYLMAVVGMSFFVRGVTGHRFWRMIHYLSFVVFLLALAHGLSSGTDSTTAWARGTYLASGGSVLFLTIYRWLTARFTARPSRDRAAVRASRTERSR